MKCIDNGVSKVNLNKWVNGPITQTQTEKGGKIPLTAVIEQATKQSQASIEEAIDKLGSAGKA